MRYHLAARYDRRLELCRYREQLLSIGDIVTSRWLDFCNKPKWSPDIARADCEDLMAADAVILFTERPNTIRAAGGRHVEFGLALAQDKGLINRRSTRERVPLFAAGLSGIRHREQGICDNKAVRPASDKVRSQASSFRTSTQPCSFDETPDASVVTTPDNGGLLE